MAISDRIQSMYEHVGDIYDSVELTGVDTTDIDKNLVNVPNTLKEGYIDIINNGTDTLYNNFPKVSGEGTSLTLNNTYQAPMRNNLKGNTYQTQYSGKNLLPPTIATETKNGITLTNNGDGSYTLTGTYSSSTEFSIDLPTTLNGTYSFSGNNPVASSNIQFRILKSSGSPWSTYLNNVNTTFENRTIENGTKQGIRIVGSFTSGFTLKPQLESGSTATSYEPYVGGIAVPNPSSPIPVNVVSGDNEIVVNGKNLFTLKNISNGTAYGIERTINNSKLKLNGTSSGAGNIIVRQTTGIVLPSGTYNISVRRSSGTITPNSKQMAFYFRSPSGTEVKSFLVNNFSNTTYSFSSSFTLTESIEIYVEIYCNGSGYAVDNLTLQFQIEKGTSASEFEQYVGDKYNINLPIENLCNNDNVLGLFLNYTNSTIGEADGSKTMYAKVPKNTELTVSRATLTNRFRIGLLNEIPQNGGTFYLAYNGDSEQLLSKTINSGNYEYVAVQYTNQDDNTNIQIEKGTKANTYTPYGTTPIELCKIGNYQDYFYKDNGNWYKYAMVGKVVFTGGESENWVIGGSYQGIYQMQISMPSVLYYGDSVIRILSDYFLGICWSNSWTKDNAIVIGGEIIRIMTSSFSTTNAFKTWLSSNNVTVYYVLKTPTITQITDTTLINQLEQFYQAQSKNNQTNISQINNDLGFIISASALKKGETIENNSASLLMSFGGLPNTNGEEETPDFEEDVSDVEEETPIEESIEEEIDEEPVEEETEIEEGE